MDTMIDDRLQRENYDVFYREFSRALILFEENLHAWDRRQASVGQAPAADGSKNSSS